MMSVAQKKRQLQSVLLVCACWYVLVGDVCVLSLVSSLCCCLSVLVWWRLNVAGCVSVVVGALAVVCCTQTRCHVCAGSKKTISVIVTATVSEIQIREREDGINSDTSPVPVSTSVDDRSGQPDETQANKTQKQNKKETTIERGNPLYSEIPRVAARIQGKFGG